MSSNNKGLDILQMFQFLNAYRGTILHTIDLTKIDNLINIVLPILTPIGARFTQAKGCNVYIAINHVNNIVTIIHNYV